METNFKCYFSNDSCEYCNNFRKQNCTINDEIERLKFEVKKNGVQKRVFM